MARSGSRAARRLNRNNRATQKFLRKRVKQPKTATRTRAVRRDRARARGARIRKQMTREHRTKISAGMLRYWRTKRNQRTTRKSTLRTVGAAGIGTPYPTGGTRGLGSRISR